MTDRLHPFSLIIFYIAAIILPAVSGNPYFYILSLITGLIMLTQCTSARDILKSLPWYLLIFVLISCFNPLFYHDGNTILFYLNGKRITIEALSYGISSALMVISVLIWCRCFTHHMTSDRVMYLFGTFSPRTAVIISMILRLVPMYREHYSTYRNTQRLLGIFGENTLLERIRGEFRLFGGFLTWILEHSMTTSDSMTARGFGTTRRRPLKIFSFKAGDIIFCLFIILNSGFIIYSLTTGVFHTTFYPALKISAPGAKTIPAYASYMLATLTPTICNLIYFVKCRETGILYEKYTQGK